MVCVFHSVFCDEGVHKQSQLYNQTIKTQTPKNSNQTTNPPLPDNKSAALFFLFCLLWGVNYSKFIV